MGARIKLRFPATVTKTERETASATRPPRYWPHLPAAIIKPITETAACARALALASEERAENCLVKAGVLLDNDADT